MLTGRGCSHGIVTELPIFGYLEVSPADDGKQLSYIAGEGAEQRKGNETLGLWFKSQTLTPILGAFSFLE